jgi:single-stranded DNA-binding protein
MTLHMLATGSLFKDPEQRFSKSGKAFSTATLKCGSGDETSWVKLVAFDLTVQSELSRLAAGDAVAVQGAVKISIYEKDGTRQLNIDLIATAITALRHPKKPRVDAAGSSSKPHAFVAREAGDA